MKAYRLLAAIAAALIPLGVAVAQHEHHGSPGQVRPLARSTDAKADEARAKVDAALAKKALIVEVAVTDDGFVPAEVKVKAGQLVRLRVTRKVEATCARDIVIKAAGINKPLPLGVPVEVELTAPKGKTRFSCAMDMTAGTLVGE